MNKDNVECSCESAARLFNPQKGNCGMGQQR